MVSVIFYSSTTIVIQQRAIEQATLMHCLFSNNIIKLYQNHKHISFF